MRSPKFTFEKIKYATDGGTFDKAVKLYDDGKVTDVQDNEYTFSAKVQGTKTYQVVVKNDYYDRGYCNCYLGQNNILCKHMVALALFLVKNGNSLTDEERQLIQVPSCNSRIGSLSKQELKEVKQTITLSLRYIKPYNGPSSTWFAYQDFLVRRM